MRNIVINNNGDSAKSLLKELMEASYKLSEAGNAVANLTVHGRNYQTCSNAQQCMNADLNERSQMLEKINDVQKTLIAWGKAIDSQS